MNKQVTEALKARATEMAEYIDRLARAAEGMLQELQIMRRTLDTLEQESTHKPAEPVIPEEPVLPTKQPSVVLNEQAQEAVNKINSLKDAIQERVEGMRASEAEAIVDTAFYGPGSVFQRLVSPRLSPFGKGVLGGTPRGEGTPADGWGFYYEEVTSVPAKMLLGEVTINSSGKPSVSKAWPNGFYNCSDLVQMGFSVDTETCGKVFITLPAIVDISSLPSFHYLKGNNYVTTGLLETPARLKVEVYDAVRLTFGLKAR